MNDLTGLQRAYAAEIAVNDALRSIIADLFEQCAMTHKHWGEGSNQKQADATIAAARAVIAKS